MSCAIEFPGSSVRIDFCSKGNKQKILIDVLTKYSEMSMDSLASVLNVPVKSLYDICEGDSFLVGKKADSLAQLFLMFFGKQFFHEYTLIRNFRD